MSRAHELSWAAGFFDGEGYISIVKRDYKGYTGFYIRIGINHVNPDPLKEMVRLFGGSLTYQNPEKVTGNRHPRTQWKLTTKQAESALIQMLPYFKNKSRAAEIALKLQASIGNHGQKRTVETTIYQALLQDQLKKLNSLD